LFALLVAVPAWAQEPGVDESDCKEQALVSRMPGCMFNELLDVYGITFATGQAAITPASGAVLNDVLAV